MNNLNVFQYVIADYKINDVFVNIYFAPAVLECFFSKPEVLSLESISTQNLDIFDGIFSIIKQKVSTYKTHEVWYDIIEYEGIQLVWKSKYIQREKTMLVNVLYCQNDQKTDIVLH